MREDGPPPGDVDPADYTHAVRAALRAALTARARLQAQTFSDQDLARIQQVLGDQVLPALANEELWRALAQLEREQARAAAERPSHTGQQPSTLWSTFAGELLGDANRQSPDAVLHGGLWTPQYDTIAEGVHLHVQMFNITVGPLVDEPVPAADDPGRRAWVDGVKVVLDKAIDMLLNLAVAAAFTVTAVQLAAERAVSGTAEVAGRALEYAGQSWPSLVAVGAVAFQAAVGVSMAKQAWESVRSARAEEAAITDPLDGHNRVRSPGTLERVAASPASEQQRPATDDRATDDPSVADQGRTFSAKSEPRTNDPSPRGDPDPAVATVDSRSHSEPAAPGKPAAVRSPYDGSGLPTRTGPPGGGKKPKPQAHSESMNSRPRPADPKPGLPPELFKKLLRLNQEGAISEQLATDQSPQEGRSGSAPPAP